MNIEFIIPTYNRPHHLMCVINSIYAQSIPNWRIHVVADAVYDGYQKVKDYFNGDDRIKFSELNGPHNDWGHTPRNYGLEHAKEEWVILSGDDNYYTPYFVEYFLVTAVPDCHFVYCDMIHNWINNAYVHIKAYPKQGQIDIGNFMTRTKLAQQLRINTEDPQADGTFVEEYLAKFPDNKIYYIDKPLYVHN